MIQYHIRRLWTPGNIGDEFHYLLKCQYFKDSRNLYLSKYYQSRVNIIKINELSNLIPDDRIGDVMVSVLASSAVDPGFEQRTASVA